MTRTQPHSSRPILNIDLSALTANYRALQVLAKPAKIGASIKADAYGLGAVRVGKTLLGQGCQTFFVAHATEGKRLRRALGKDPEIFVFSGPTPKAMSLLIKADLKPVINSLAQARFWLSATRGLDNIPGTALHFDTGINRLGIPEDERAIFTGGGTGSVDLACDLVMSHLACAAWPDHELNRKQLKRFLDIRACFPKARASLANTGGIYLGSDFHFALVRPGIGLFGGSATGAREREKVHSVVSLAAPILQIKNVPKGDTLGYDATFRAEQDMTVAIAGVGYADGLPVALSGPDETPAPAAARIAGISVPVVGRVSMDYTILDITGYEADINLGDEAEFLGPDLDACADRAGTINYELLTHLGSRCKRRYL